MSSGHVVEAYYQQKHSKLSCEVEKIYRDLAQRHDHSREVDFLKDVPVNQKSLGNLVDAIEE